MDHLESSKTLNTLIPGFFPTTVKHVCPRSSFSKMLTHNYMPKYTVHLFICICKYLICVSYFHIWHTVCAAKKIYPWACKTILVEEKKKNQRISALKSHHVMIKYEIHITPIKEKPRKWINKILNSIQFN